MNNYYVLDAALNVKEYIYLDKGLEMLIKACETSEFQYLDRKVISLEIEQESGDIFQDFTYFKNVPIISDRFKNMLLKESIDYLYYKKILLTKKDIGMEEMYWLALPPRINCLDKANSEIDEILNFADVIAIMDDKIGNYELFKLSNVTNQEIIVTERLADKIKNMNFVGVHIYKLNM